MYIQGVADFVDDVLGGFGLVALAALNGSLAWWLVVLRTGKAGTPAAAVEACALWLRRGAISVAVIQALALAVQGVVLAASLGELPWGAFLATTQVQAGSARLLLAAVLAALAVRAAKEPASSARWWQVSGAAAAVLVAGAWLVHGVGRLEHRALLMTVTVVHQLAAAVWVGGVMQLLVLWRAGRGRPELREFFPPAVARFSPLGMAAVALLIGSGWGLAWAYVASWAGVFGTGYGSLIAAKVVLLVLILGFAAMNYTAGRRWLRRSASAVLTRVPFYVETELLLLITVLFAAATVSSQPPAVDIPNLTVPPREVAAMFAPHIPSLTSPSLDALISGEAGRLAVVNHTPSQAATLWSDYNHNVSGLFLIVTAIVALVSYLPGARLARWWPLGFILLSVFLFFRSDAETWPLGPVGFWESTLGNSEVLQHRLATVLAMAVGIVELRARIYNLQRGRAAFLFPVLAAAGGVLLLTHAHVAFEIKSEYLIQSTHLVLGLLAIVLAGGRWMELRLATCGVVAASRAAGLVSITALLLSGYVLFVYQEPLY